MLDKEGVFIKLFQIVLSIVTNFITQLLIPSFLISRSRIPQMQQYFEAFGKRGVKPIVTISVETYGFFTVAL